MLEQVMIGSCSHWLRKWHKFCKPRDYEVRERIPVPHDNYFQSFFSLRHAILRNYNPPLSLKLNDITLTDQ